LRWEIDSAGVTVVTDQGVERAERLVIAAGAWSASLLGELEVHLQVLRKHQYWFEPEQVGYDLDDGFPCFFHETTDGFFYGFPSIDGSGVKVARHSGGEKIDQPTQPHTPDVTDRELVDRYVAQCLPGVGSQLVAQAGCYYTVTTDEHFIIDQHPNHPQVTIVAGLSGHGFKFTSVLGELASQLATAKKTNIDIDLFVINRTC
jgi:glycine/D-amino acid oxidase-like deaminating enzyme